MGTLECSENPIISAKELRLQLKERLPKGIFKPQPHKAFSLVFLFLLHVAIASFMIFGKTPWYVDLPLALVIGCLMVSYGFLAHEASHGAFTRNKKIQNFLLWLGFGPIMLTPSAWRTWHVVCHHGLTQTKGDVDYLGKLGEPKNFFDKIIVAFFPGSGSILSYITLLFSAFLQGQLFIWYHSSHLRLQGVNYNVWKERVLCLVLWSMMIALWVWIGWEKAIFVVLIPTMVANSISGAYTFTNHSNAYAPEDSDDWRTNTISVKTLPLFDWMHHCFSYHQEHHIFPSMSHNNLHLVRDELKRIAPNASQVLNHWTAFKLAYTTPRIYKDEKTLCDTKGQNEVDLDKLLAQHLIT